MQLSFFSIVTKNELRVAWDWLVKPMNHRPTAHCGHCVFDHKQWYQQPLKDEPKTHVNLGTLYLTSSFADDNQIFALANRDVSADIETPNLDSNIAKTVKNSGRFRDALSEHLGFWVRLATASQSQTPSTRFASAKPNVIPENQGPDGLIMVDCSATNTQQIEIQSVKNPSNNPRSMVATTSFRTQGKVHNVNKPKLLEDFWLVKNESVGITYLQNMLSGLCGQLQLTADQRIKFGLLADTAYNAVIVANDKHATATVFEGYDQVTTDASKCFATYIGSNDWDALAEATRKVLLKRLSHLL